MHLNFHVSRGHNAALWPRRESEDRYFLHFEGVAEDNKGRAIALVKGTVFLFGQMTDEQQSWFEICDAYTQETTDVYEAMCDGNDYQDFVDSPLSGYDLLYIESVKILPSHRGQGLGHPIVLSTIQTFGRGCAAVVIEPHPFRVSDERRRAREQNTELDIDKAMRGWRRIREPDADFDKAMGWDQLAKTEAQYKAGAKKLAKHWGKLGFVKVPKSKRFWYLDMSSFVVSETIEAEIEGQADVDDED